MYSSYTLPDTGNCVLLVVAELLSCCAAVWLGVICDNKEMARQVKEYNTINLLYDQDNRKKRV